MTEEQKRIRELEEKLEEQQDEIIFYKTHFQVCAKKETGPQRKRFYEGLVRHAD